MTNVGIVMVLVEQANPDRMGTTREPTLNSFQSALNSRNDESARSVSPGYSLSILVRSRGNYDLITSRWSPHLKKRVAAVCSRMLSTAGNTAGKKIESGAHVHLDETILGKIGKPFCSLKRAHWTTSEQSWRAFRHVHLITSSEPLI